ncbi:uncharacterized protein LOC127252662 [Andrographis paniculata]|uniref:uncharacterized protein LOC127252661 n=1 Tax=Andrographis paniculata TaxID=175694 RepID=UPI0021E7B88E|nr:uncharacterized protein LOC127252661 [Andrographis paniculata]XP_051132900.1 uncharacterized protein LOC127252662 [Andrographis paniculata]
MAGGKLDKGEEAEVYEYGWQPSLCEDEEVDEYGLPSDIYVDDATWISYLERQDEARFQDVVRILGLGDTNVRPSQPLHLQVQVPNSPTPEAIGVGNVNDGKEAVASSETAGGASESSVLSVADVMACFQFRRGSSNENTEEKPETSRQQQQDSTFTLDNDEFPTLALAATHSPPPRRNRNRNRNRRDPSSAVKPNKEAATSTSSASSSSSSSRNRA